MIMKGGIKTVLGTLALVRPISPGPDEGECIWSIDAIVICEVKLKYVKNSVLNASSSLHYSPRNEPAIDNSQLTTLPMA
jgi:hypothetical protein